MGRERLLAHGQSNCRRGPWKNILTRMVATFRSQMITILTRPPTQKTKSRRHERRGGIHNPGKRPIRISGREAMVALVPSSNHAQPMEIPQVPPQLGTQPAFLLSVRQGDSNFFACCQPFDNHDATEHSWQTAANNGSQD